MSEIKFSVLENRAILKVIGEDARGFLQGLVSNDLMEASPQNTIYAALLTPQGKYLHDFFITQSGKAFLLDCEADRIDDLYKRLRLYKLGAKIDLELDSENSIVAVIGDQAPEALGIAPLAGSTISYLNGLAFVDPRLPKMGVRMVPASETVSLFVWTSMAPDVSVFVPSSRVPAAVRVTAPTVTAASISSTPAAPVMLTAAAVAAKSN